jgi:hypothetical protein
MQLVTRTCCIYYNELRAPPPPSPDYARINLMVDLWAWLTGREVGAKEYRRMKRLTDGNAKCRHFFLKKLFCKGTLRQVFSMSEVPFPSNDPILLPPLIDCIRVYSILIHTGKGGGEELTREKVRGAMVHKASRKYQHVQSIISIKRQ